MASREPGQNEQMHPDSQQMTTARALDMAMQHHQAGDVAKAESIYRQILRVQPNHSGALHLLGYCCNRGRVRFQQLPQLPVAGN